MKKILLYCLIYLCISLIFYLITIDFSKTNFMCEDVRQNSIVQCNNIKYFLSETPLGALVNLSLYPFMLFILILLIKLNYKKYKNNV